MICNKCKKEIDDNSKLCGYCGNTVNNKKNKFIIGIIIGLSVIVFGACILVVKNNINKENNNTSISYEKIDFTEFKIVLNNKEYKITNEIKVSDFINNGWVIQYGGEILNQTIEEIKNSLEQDVIYVANNSVYLEQGNLELGIYFDMSLTNVKVIDSKVIAISIYKKDENKSSDFDFYGLKLGNIMTEKQYKEMFGEKNFVMLEDDINHYYKKTIELENNFEIGIELTTRVDTNELVSITINRN